MFAKCVYPRMLIVLLFLLGALGHSNSFAEPAKIVLWPDGAPGAKGTAEADVPKLFVYPAAESRNSRTAVVICPGGGYQNLAIEHEGKQIATWLNSLGITAAILDYRVAGKGYAHPAPLQDAQRAIRVVRSHSDSWQVDQNRIGIIGFSAGGHLASSAGTHFDAGDPTSSDPIDRLSCRPDFMVLCYAVIAFDQPYTHRGSQRNLLGENPSKELVQSMSSEKMVTAETPPTFLWHTNTDDTVPPENSAEFYLALCRAKVPAELHIFETGDHGLGLAENFPAVKPWSRLCETWMRSHHWLP
ncbi:MAG: alpha/beta hydrolase [Planctomycetota bacterium]|nr:alpha/beta hydrolase [Planctomycetota bacterium]MDA1178589.1 alpha/beta hydrolase [Planctomycetota bacterium]